MERSFTSFDGETWVGVKVRLFWRMFAAEYDDPCHGRVFHANRITSRWSVTRMDREGSATPRTRSQCCCPRDHGLGLEWSRGQICRSWSWSWLPVLVLVLLLNKTKTLLIWLISTVRSQPQCCDYYTSLRPTVPVFDMMHPSLDFMQSWNCICLYQRHDICAGWKGVQPRWPIYEATLCQTGRICVIPPCVLYV